MSQSKSAIGDTSSSVHDGGLPAALSTVEAAKFLNMSTPVVIMLSDAGKLGPIETTEDGDRLFRRDALDRYRAQTLAEFADAPTPRQAGIEAGLYEHDDSQFVNITRG